jgi:hypothetical protein
MLMEYLSDVMTWEVTGHAEQTARVVPTHAQPVRLGEVIGFEYIIGNATNAITMTFNLYDPNGKRIHQTAGIARNVTTPEKISATDTDSIPIFGPGWIIGFDPSGDSGEILITAQLRVFYKTV